MLAKLSTLLLALPLVSALTVNPIVGGTTGGTATITWTASTTDPAYFNLELEYAAFNSVFAIANTVQTSLGQITIELPQVPVGATYTLVAYSTTDVNDVYSTSTPFVIGAASSTSTTAASTTSGASTSGSATASSATVTSPVSSAASVASSATAAASSSSAASSPSALSSGAAPFKMTGVAPAAALVLSAVAGAAMVF